jgi:hypothetical protein
LVYFFYDVRVPEMSTPLCKVIVSRDKNQKHGMDNYFKNM